MDIVSGEAGLGPMGAATPNDSPETGTSAPVTTAPDSAAGRVPVPDTLEEVLSPAWLSQALGQRFPGVEVPVSGE